MTERMERKKTMNVFREAQKAWGSYDDYPVGAVGIDPMPHLSRNRVPQPFFLVTEQDEVLIQMSGECEIEFKEIEPAWMRLIPGDTVYLPGGVPSRIVPRGESVQVRLKAEPPLREAVAWYCPRCGGLVHAQEFVAAIPQDEYWQAVSAFNADERLRTCGACGEVHPAVEVGDIAWPEVAEAIRVDGAPGG